MLNDLRAIISERLLSWALVIAPEEERAQLAFCLHAYFKDSLRRRGHPVENP